MKPKRIPTPDELAFFDAFLDETKWQQYLQSHGIKDDPDLPVCLATVPTAAWIDYCKVLPTPAIARYLQSDDTLTDHTIDCMEMAIETAYQVKPPWCITSIRDGTEEDGNLSVRYFYLLKEI
jgi:hypothetical protein